MQLLFTGVVAMHKFQVQVLQNLFSSILCCRMVGLSNVRVSGFKSECAWFCYWAQRTNDINVLQLKSRRKLIRHPLLYKWYPKSYHMSIICAIICSKDVFKQLSKRCQHFWYICLINHLKLIVWKRVSSKNKSQFGPQYFLAAVFEVVSHDGKAKQDEIPVLFCLVLYCKWSCGVWHLMRERWSILILLQVKSVSINVHHNDLIFGLPHLASLSATMAE